MQERATSIQNALTQNLIILDAGFGVDPSSPASAEEHGTISTSLKQNLDDLEHLSAKSDNNFSPRLHDIIAAEKLVLASYNAKLSALKKALEYNPADDIGLLNLGDQKGELLGRTVNAKKGLETIRSKHPVEIDEQSSQLLSESINCFSSLEATIQSAPDDAIMGVRQQCIDAFGKAKQALNQNLIATLNNEAMKNQRQATQALIKNLGTASH